MKEYKRTYFTLTEFEEEDIIQTSGIGDSGGPSSSSNPETTVPSYTLNEYEVDII